MANILDYLDWRGDLTLAQNPFNEVDNLILAELSFVDFGGIVPGPGEGRAVPLWKAAEAYFAKTEGRPIDMGVLVPNQIPELLRRTAASPRFRDMKLNGFVDHLDTVKAEQFAALAAECGDGTVYLSFRGTDDTLAGWKEDFYLSCMREVPAQKMAVAYTEAMAHQYPRIKLRLGGHSKGGNLAVYSAMKCAPFVRKRIQKIYSLDGPGFRPEVLKECHYNAIEDKVVKLLPHSSMIGMIFERDIHYRVVESKNHGLLQHDPFSWLVKDDHFVDVGDIYESQKIMNEALNEWILSLNEEQVRTFVDTLYQVISASQADDLITFTADWKKSMNAVVTALKEVDDQTAEMLRGIIRSLFEIARCKVKEELIATKKTRHRFKNTKRAGKAEEVRPDPAASPDATVTQGSAARHAPKLRGNHRQGRPG